MLTSYSQDNPAFRAEFGVVFHRDSVRSFRRAPLPPQLDPTSQSGSRTSKTSIQENQPEDNDGKENVE